MKRFGMGLALSVLLIPQITLAATPQQMLDRGIQLSLERQPQTSTVDITFTYRYRPVVRTEQGGEVRVHLLASSEMFPRAEASMDSEQRFRVESLQISAAPELGFPEGKTWKDPISFETKMIGDVSYIRIATLSDELRSLAQSLPLNGIDINAIVGYWLKIDQASLQQAIQHIAPTANFELPIRPQNEVWRTWQPILQTPGLLRALRLESKNIRNGTTYLRIPFQINNQLWTEVEKMLRQQIETGLAPLKTQDRSTYNLQYNEQTKNLRTIMATIKREVGKIRFVAVVNQGTGQIERIEAAGKTTQPSYTERYVGNRLVKRLSGYHDLSYTFISSMKRTMDREVTSPTNSVTIAWLINWMQEKFLDSMNTSSTDSLTP